MGMTMKQLRRYEGVKTVEELEAWLADEIKHMQQQLKESPKETMKDRHAMEVTILCDKIESELVFAQQIQKKLRQILLA